TPLPPGGVKRMATPVSGAATADTSAMPRRLPQPVDPQLVTLVWNAFARVRELQPLPAPSQAVSELRAPVAVSVSRVPPTAITCGSAAGYEVPNPLSPEEAVIATPGWLNAGFCSPANSLPP